ncbi:sigma-70 family RNA polymerase sigma factor [Aquiflexum sp. LQ15W]|uniref:RNA polymerase sigma factor n=1 Tax=Cognataquiflexum nitidum TaxID=2922272 RepID=UPI001F13EE15|nr:sigma-70 family RNA polymerase sigma factor [Cognataquiflexum nitidum]MCH6198975.1 sigma-70 family RNA polymerase sigma factor [Cognataquiflexum nitidum]
MKKNGKYSEQELISAIVNRENVNQAIRFMYEGYYRYLENYVLQNSGSSDDAADMIQEAFLVFIKVVEENKFRQDSGVKSFLYSIVRNLWITELRKRKSMEIRNEMFENAKESVTLDISHSLVKHESHKLIMELFQSLGQKCKNILLLFYYENLPMKEIMEQEDYSSEQVLRNKKHKCLKSLIEKIQSDEKTYSTVKNALQYAG